MTAELDRTSPLFQEPENNLYTAQNLRVPWIDARSKTDLCEVTAEAWHALQDSNDPPTCLRQARNLVAVHDDDGTPAIAQMGPDEVRWWLANAAKWYVYDKNGDHVLTRPPMDVARAVIASVRD